MPPVYSVRDPPGLYLGSIPPPPPGCFLEVLIVEGLRLHVLEVLILEDLLSAMLILMDFKSFIISDLIKNEGFTEVLILGGLGRARCTDGWAVVGKVTRCGDPLTPSAFASATTGRRLLRGRAPWK